MRRTGLSPGPAPPPPGRLYGQALSDLMGYLVTHLTWDDGTPVVLEQYFDWRAQNDDEVLR